MQANLIEQGLNLMLYGMGTVFIFLTVLVFATTLMSRLVGRFAPTANAESDSLSTKAAQPASAAPHIVEAIRLAIQQHRQPS